MIEPIYLTIAKIVAIPAFVLGLWNFLNPLLSKIRICIIPEMQVQILKDKELNAYNVLFTIITKGPSHKCITFKFISSKLTTPNGNSFTFRCSSYLEEKGNSQSSKSRNIPIPMYGRNAINVTTAFQSDDINSFVPGKSKIEFEIIKSNNKKIKCKSVEFNISDEHLELLNDNRSIIMLECLKYDK